MTSRYEAWAGRSVTRDEQGQFARSAGSLARRLSNEIGRRPRKLTEEEQDLADELADNGAQVNPDGTVTAYHFTTPEQAEKIRRTGRMTGLEDGLFFTTKDDGGQGGAGRGGGRVALRVPLAQALLDDAFGDEAHLRVSLRRAGDSLDVSGWLDDDAVSDLGPTSAEDFTARIHQRHPDVKLDLHGKPGGKMVLGRIVVPERSRGTGTAIMNNLVAMADRTGTTLALTPSSDFGGSKTRLIAFYKRFGFVENKGRNKDYEISQTMYRVPR